MFCISFSPSEDILVLIFGPYEYAKLCGKRDFASLIKVMDFKRRRLFWITWVGSIHLHGPLKVENFLQLEAEETQRKIKSKGFYT